MPILAALAAVAILPGTATGIGGKERDNSATALDRSHPDRLPARPTIDPAISIPLEPLGFSAPGPIYLGQRWTLASLDFIDENRLLFTFRIPGLIHRQYGAGNNDVSEERHIKAIVLDLPAGTVQADAIWALHDRMPYLWMLKDGHFLLRDRNELQVGDASLALKPFLQFPGRVLSLELDPSGSLLVTNSHEPATAAGNGANVAPDHEPEKPDEQQLDTVLRILKRDSGKVMLVSRVRAAVHLTINSDGYLSLLPGDRGGWLVTLNGFDGGTTKLGQVESTCVPSYDFVSQREFLLTTCNRQEIRQLTAMNTDGKRLWQDAPSSSPIWPLYVTSANGARIARESLVTNYSVTAFAPLSFEDVKGQLVEIFDSATGKILLAAPASPVLDGGGNVAISPSGRRAAILNAGAIQVFDLPEPGAAPQRAADTRTAKSGP
jgi:hypothetical protein